MDHDRIFHFNINVANLDRSIDFYRMLGFKVLHRERIDPEANRAILAKFGEEEENGAEYALIRLGDDSDATCIDLVQYDTRVPADPPPVNQIGIGRIALQFGDPDSLLSVLANAGVEMLGPRGRTAPWDRAPNEMFCFRDPDGIIVEIVSDLDHLVRPARDTT